MYTVGGEIVKFIEDMLDLIATIFLLGLTISISFTVVLPIFNEDKNQVGLVDKSSPEFLGYELDDNYDGALGYLDVILATQMQDFNLPEPKRFTIATENPSMILVDTTFNSAYNLNQVKNVIVDLLNREGTENSRYRMSHNYGLTVNNSTNIITNGTMEGAIDFNNSSSPWTLGGVGSIDATVSQISGAKVISGNRSVAISTPSSDLSSREVKEVNLYQSIYTVTDNSRYLVSADVYCENCSAKIIVERHAHDGSIYDDTRSEEVMNTGVGQSKNLKVNFEVSSNIKSFVVRIEKVGGAGNGQIETMVVDNVEFRVFKNSDPFYEFVRVN